MNKKFLMFGIPILALALVAAGVAYYAMFSTTFTVNSAITGEGELSQVLDEEFFTGEDIFGQEITLTNNAPSERTISITNDAPDEVDVFYVSETQLSKKEVVFGSEPWNLINGDNTKVNLRYVLVGDEFKAEIENPIEGYVLIYYKDNSDRFNYPAQAILIEDVNGNLPYEDDGNIDENDYSEEYVTPHGAKIWYVPEETILNGNELDWNRASEFYFETELIQYNSDGQIIIYPGQVLSFTPVYNVNEYANGTYTIQTIIT